ncbi:MAG: hypothetical protein KGZ81_12660 [Flavobacteriales bacterium]|nr:hypothetical protein [Flavobacteriales bacterium]
MKKNLILLLLATNLSVFAQEKPSGAKVFWDNLQALCGKSFEGTITEAPANDSFRGKKLTMHVKSCSNNKIRIPFVVGEDYSRTWILTFENDLITLKHDHRHEDGSEDKITQYGGTASNPGLENLQMFPADNFTCNLLGYACTNVWYLSLTNETFGYHLVRIGSDRKFSVQFDLQNPVENPKAPWGWED